MKTFSFQNCFKTNSFSSESEFNLNISYLYMVETNQFDFSIFGFCIVTGADAIIKAINFYDEKRRFCSNGSSLEIFVFCKYAYIESTNFPF